MTEPKQTRSKATKTARTQRTFESDAFALTSLRLIAAPDPKDDLSDEELVAFCKKQSYSSETIQSLIDFVKSI